MINKLYDKIISILKENYKFFIILIIVGIISLFPLPYYINAPGGIIDISDRIEIQDKKEISGSFNLAYVSELKGTIPTIIFSLFNKKWDIIKKSDIVYDNENIDDVYFRDHLLLDEANQNALLIAYEKANKPITIKKTELYVTYIDKLAKTNLKIGDQILEINNKVITDKESLYNTIKQYKENDILSIKVKKKNQISIKKATLINNENNVMIGIMVSEKKEIETDPKIDINFEKSESGPSGGLMMTLAIYNYLTNQDLTKGLKIVGTGTIDEQGNVGSIGGIQYKMYGAIKDNADIFFVPAGKNYKDALKIKQNTNSKMKLIAVAKFEDAIKYLESI